MEFFASGDTLLRLGFFCGAFVVLASLETAFPRRCRKIPRGRRWPSNISVSVLNQLFIRLVLPISTAALSISVEQNQWGLFAHLPWARWIEVLAAILILDLAIYAQHRAYHAVPVLWRFHRMHHADLEFDLTTGIRFHPVSVLVSAMIKLAVIVATGAAPVAVLTFEVILNITSLFNHCNLNIPYNAERGLRLLVVTPDMHRLHHSKNPNETDRNFGFNFPWWDRIFGSYQEQPAAGHHDMPIGLQQFREEQELRLDRMLSQPFRGNAED
jgi:sterol desaturase/sphingolipid hydroxylase (fatty acid hydroxylase superfamily)